MSDKREKESLWHYAIRALAFMLSLAVVIILMWFVFLVLWTPLG